MRKVFVFVVLAMVMCFAIVNVQAECITNGTLWGAVTREDLKLSSKYMGQKDFGAMDSLVRQNRIFLLNKVGIAVEIDEREFFGLYKCHIRGTTLQFWTFREAIDCK